MKKRIISVVMATILAFGSLAGCDSSNGGATGGTTTDPAGSGTETSGGGSDVAADGATEITWMFWDNLEASEDLTTIGYKQVIDRFNEQYAGQYHVTPITTNLEEYDTKLNALITSGDAPDLWICNPGPNLTQYVDTNNCMDLTELLKTDNADWYGTFTDGIFERMTYDGKIMAVPTCFQAACCYYNTDLFAQAGCEVPTTWTELIDTCQKLQDAGITPISVSSSTAWCLSMVAGYLCDRQGGAEALEGINAGTTHWTDDNYVKAITKLKELSQYFQPTTAGDSNDVATQNFYDEQAAMLIQGSWVIGQMNGANPAIEDKCGIFPFPSIEDGAGDAGRLIVKTDNLVVSAAAKDNGHLDAIVALMKTFTDDEAQAYMAEIAGKFPVTNVEFDLEKAPKQLSFVKDILDNKTTGTLGFYNESFTTVEAGSFFDDCMVEVVLGVSTPEEALKKCDDWFAENIWNK